MIEEAKKKIQEEINKSKNPNLKSIGSYLLEQIEINRDAAKKINSKDKTLSGAHSKVVNEARKRAVDGGAYIEDYEVYKMVRDYFEFEAVQNKIMEVEVNEIKEDHKIEVVKTESEDLFSVSLDDFM